MSETVLKVENLSKLYELGEVGTGTLSHDLNRWWAKMRGKEDPFALVGQINDRNKKAESDFVWSLKDINFEVKQGEVLGIIGRNGAGKSTLLKIISQITSPTTGSIKAKGRIASLLEVGTGMNPELTARENIYLNGAILGMTRREIAAKFDEIVDFSGCTMYVDTPVKRFSSGMRVRLGFAVAAFLEPEILIVDEVLAVGDAEFQKKAIGKMKDISEGGGRTVLFVSHNLSAVKELCDKGIVMENGQLVASSSVSEALSFYSLNNTGSTLKDLNNPKFHSGASQYSQIINLNVLDTVTLEKKTTFLMGDDILIKVQLKIKKQMPNVEVGIKLSSINGVALSYFVSDWEGLSGSLEQGLHEFSIKIPQIPFLPGKYFLSPWVLIKGHASVDSVQEAVLLEIIQDDINGHMAYFDKYAYSGCEVYLPSSWEKVNNN